MGKKDPFHGCMETLRMIEQKNFIVLQNILYLFRNFSRNLLIHTNIPTLEYSCRQFLLQF